MKKQTRIAKLLVLAWMAPVLSGCVFILKDDPSVQYYGIDQQRGNEYLSQVMDKQEQVYQAGKAVKETQS